jgi:hypothetical protein
MAMRRVKVVGRWRPVAVWAGTSAAANALVLLGGGAHVEAVAFVALPLAAAALLGLIVVRGALLPMRYLQGLREGAGDIEVLEDELEWFGGRRIVARAAGGRWVLESVSGAKSAALFVQEPGMEEPAPMRGRAHEEGRKAGERARAGGLTSPHSLARSVDDI